MAEIGDWNENGCTICHREIDGRKIVFPALVDDASPAGLDLAIPDRVEDAFVLVVGDDAVPVITYPDYHGDAWPDVENFYQNFIRAHQPTLGEIRSAIAAIESERALYDDAARTRLLLIRQVLSAWMRLADIAYVPPEDWSAYEMTKGRVLHDARAAGSPMMDASDWLPELSDRLGKAATTGYSIAWLWDELVCGCAVSWARLEFMGVATLNGSDPDLAAKCSDGIEFHLRRLRSVYERMVSIDAHAIAYRYAQSRWVHGIDRNEAILHRVQDEETIDLLRLLPTKTRADLIRNKQILNRGRALYNELGNWEQVWDELSREFPPLKPARLKNLFGELRKRDEG